jgi:hypothetical protein
LRLLQARWTRGPSTLPRRGAQLPTGGGSGGRRGRGGVGGGGGGRVGGWGGSSELNEEHPQKPLRSLVPNVETNPSTDARR